MTTDPDPGRRRPVVRQLRAPTPGHRLSDEYTEGLWGIIRHRPAWFQDAACAAEPHFWDSPKAGRNPHCRCGCDPAQPVWFDDDARTAVCADCPVYDECAAEHARDRTWLGPAHTHYQPKGGDTPL